MNKIAIQSIDSAASIDVGSQQEARYAGPYNLHLDVKVVADSHEEAVRMVEQRLTENDND